VKSANGYILKVDGYEIAASWPAPYFALVTDAADDPCPPLLYHCDTIQEAASKGGTLLGADFLPVDYEPTPGDPRPDPRTHPEYWTE